VFTSMKKDPEKKSDEKAVHADSPNGDPVPARGMSDDLVDGETVDIPEKSKKPSEQSVE
jgi:hypothetical protein